MDQTFRVGNGRFRRGNGPLRPRCWFIESKKPIKKNHTKEFGGGNAPGTSRGKNSGRPKDTRDVWADSRGRMSAGGGQMMGQMGHVHGTDGTQTRGCPAKILYVYWLFSFPKDLAMWKLVKSKRGRPKICHKLRPDQVFPRICLPKFGRSSGELLGWIPTKTLHFE